ncbi:MAG: EamA family transporter [Lachnospiraceae bacterium]|nr:EamA family transporter [Lachnospiraceae bacterium]
MLWVWLVLLYGVIKGTREIIKKKSMEKNTVLEVLFVYTLLSFLMVVPGVTKAGGVDASTMVLIALKSFVIFVAWIFSFKAIKKMPISLYGLLDLSRVIFSTLMGVIFLREGMTFWQTIGLVLVCAGLLLYRYQTGEKRTKKKALAGGEVLTKEPAERVEFKIVCFALLSCLLNGVSGTMDKVLMLKISSTQLQFWYMLFLVLYYLLYIIVTKTKIRLVSALKNYWIWILSLIFVIGDKALFIANQSPDSKVTIMTLLKQAGCIVTILAGKFIFKEKNIGYKLFCAGVIIAGIVLSVAMK